MSPRAPETVSPIINVSIIIIMQALVIIFNIIIIMLSIISIIKKFDSGCSIEHHSIE